MAEAEWMAATTPVAIVRAAERQPVRKKRLWAIACVRRLTAHWNGFGAFYDAGLDLVTQYADDAAHRPTVVALQKQIGDELRMLKRAHPDEFPYHYICICRAARIAFFPESVDLTNLTLQVSDAVHVIRDRSDWGAEEQTDLLLARCVFGNPFRPVAFDLSWRTEAVMSLTQGMYESRDFAPMPVLADALEDAGCDHPDVLAHCRGGGPHVRGCWVVDLLLGKS